MNETFYKDKVVWITGASSGIGEELVKEAARRGAKIVLSARRSKELERVKKECGLTKTNSLVLPLDLEDYKKLKNLPKKVIDQFQKIDVLINNGGISQRSYTYETALDTYEKLMDVNYFGNIALSLAVLPILRRQKNGVIASISSVAGLFGVPLRSGYSATKAALTGFYEALRAENTNENVKVCLIYPGFIRTQISNNALKGDGSKQGKMDEVIEQGIAPDECARRILDGIATSKNKIVIAGRREKIAIFIHKFFPGIFAKSIAKAKVT
ncbi:SDR family oxidoreductase [Leptospira alstonii]|uniref:KR domain protein n=2 Tax=Leptospira alstonii TaxID=28452 RepID=M6CFB0_9LEPT|nr:SDR family oxidoreductase [Leptospira alstonii]EMJ90552.1 KR domain protein [Leptospira alstonii serovar Sichuan str. 79601]EQA82108.1 KR domain protein [Leptospira alstonii serovar Pingchang str. 80-412]